MMESCKSLLVAKLDIGLELQQGNHPGRLFLGGCFKESLVLSALVTSTSAA
jgi:hypothetical protein